MGEHEAKKEGVPLGFGTILFVSLGTSAELKDFFNFLDDREDDEWVSVVDLQKHPVFFPKYVENLLRSSRMTKVNARSSSEFGILLTYHPVAGESYFTLSFRARRPFGSDIKPAAK